jgi:hypothetical protein
MTHAPGAATDVAHPNKQLELDRPNHELAQANLLADHLALEIDRAPAKHLDYVARQIWQAHACGAIDDDTAQGLAEALRERQRGPMPGIGGPSNNAPRRPPRSPDRQRSLERRRRLSAAGMMPPALALRFTVGERAVLYVIATEIKRRGRCDLYVDQIAAFSGTSRSTTKNAVRMAKRLRLIKITEWKQAPDWNGPNQILIVSQEWLAWLAHGRKEMTVKNLTTTDRPVFYPRTVSREEGLQRAYRTRKGGGAVP